MTSAVSDSGTRSSAPHPQFNIDAFAHVQSNGAVDGTDDRETVEAEGPPAKDR